MHLEILDDTRRSLLPLLVSLKQHFYLAGDTALAVQIGHRDSIDFDFFSPENFDTQTLFKTCESIFSGHTLLKTQDERDTLSIPVDNTVALSFLGFPSPLMENVVETDDLNLASIIDIGCMKLSAITSRSAMKDYIDLYYILKVKPLSILLEATHKKFPTLDQNLILKSLVYFDDIAPEEIRFTRGYEIPFDEVRKSLEEIVRETIKKTP